VDHERLAILSKQSVHLTYLLRTPSATTADAPRPPPGLPRPRGRARRLSGSRPPRVCAGLSRKAPGAARAAGGGEPLGFAARRVEPHLICSFICLRARGALGRSRPRRAGRGSATPIARSSQRIPSRPAPAGALDAPEAALGTLPKGDPGAPLLGAVEQDADFKGRYLLLAGLALLGELSHRGNVISLAPGAIPRYPTGHGGQVQG